MLSHARTEAFEKPNLQPVLDASSIYKLSFAAFEQIARHRTPPDPVTYALWYAYAGQSPKGLVSEIDQHLATGRNLSPFEIREIHNAYLAEAPAGRGNAAIGREFQNSLSKVADLIEQGVHQNSRFKATLDDVETCMPVVATPDALQVVLNRLVEESQQLAGMSDILTMGLKESQAQVAQLNLELEQARQQTLTDPLTLIANRRGFDARIKAQIEIAEQSETRFCLVLADLDKFKSVNDDYGHQAGDAVLRAFAGLLAENTKGHDLVARIGGDEFAVMLPDTTPMTAHNLMVAIKHKLSQVDVSALCCVRAAAPVTASFGISIYRPGRKAADMIALADTKLGQAKATGRNHVSAEGLN